MGLYLIKAGLNRRQTHKLKQFKKRIAGERPQNIIKH